MPEPKHNRGKSNQSYATPKEFIQAVKRGLGGIEFAYDLAATAKNTQAAKWWSPEQDSLKQAWDAKGWNWLNPPYGHITPWVEKAFTDSLKYDTSIAMLIPASVGSNWWRNYVHMEARVWLLNRRIQFVGAPTVSPKDHALLIYAPWLESGYHIWDWAQEHVYLAEPH